MNGAVPVARGCGTRVAGGIYAECGTSENGLPVEAFIMDPPEAIPEHLHLAPQGVAWVERRGVWHLVDWVGSEHYPNVADFIEECRRYGLSRRVPRTAPFERLTPASRILLVHARAIITNGAAYRPKDGAPYSCPMAATARWEQARGAKADYTIGLPSFDDQVRNLSHILSTEITQAERELVRVTARIAKGRALQEAK